jgi:hypothetical protein
MDIKNLAVELDRQRLDALLKADCAALERLMAPGGLYIHTAGNIDTRDEFIEKVRNGALTYRRIENKVEAVTEAAGTVLLAGVIDIDVERSGVPASIHVRYCCNWVEAGGSMQMVSWQATPLAR